jgi:hypothetical protein
MLGVRSGLSAETGFQIRGLRSPRRSEVTSGHPPWGEPRARGRARGDPVDAEGLPVVAVEVPGHEVPAAGVRDEVVGLHAARRRVAFPDAAGER